MTLVLDAQVTDTEWAQIVDRISRRRFFGGAAGVAAALALSACGSSDGESDSASDTLPYTWAEFSGDVPRDPKRVVVLDGRVDLEFAMMMDLPDRRIGQLLVPRRQGRIPVSRPQPSRTRASSTSPATSPPTSRLCSLSSPI